MLKKIWREAQVLCFAGHMTLKRLHHDSECLWLVGGECRFRGAAESYSQGEVPDGEGVPRNAPRGLELETEWGLPRPSWLGCTWDLKIGSIPNRLGEHPRRDSASTTTVNITQHLFC